jgi:glycosyltransferase involved in cell wall biosynthesis
MRSWYSQLAHNDLVGHERHHAEVDAILCIGEHGSTINAPLYVYQDFCFGHGLQLMDRGLVPHGWDAVSRAALERRAAHQAETYARAAGVFTMSAWNAAYLRDAGLVSPDRIHVVHAGVNVPVDPPSADRMAMRAEAREHVVAFVGRDFERKGGDMVVAAVQQLRGMLSRPVRLVVAGPSQWPMDGPVPDGVTFLGDAPFHGVRALLRTADVLVMPSRFEAFGIIIAEALGSGTPVVGRNDFAMPEMIRHGENGMLVEGDAVDELAHALFHVISSDHITSTCIADAERVRSYFSWDRVAEDMTAVLRKGRS